MKFHVGVGNDVPAPAGPASGSKLILLGDKGPLIGEAGRLCWLNSFPMVHPTGSDLPPGNPCSNFFPICPRTLPERIRLARSRGGPANSTIVPRRTSGAAAAVNRQDVNLLHGLLP